jgi:hypothetical protein
VAPRVKPFAQALARKGRGIGARRAERGEAKGAGFGFQGG